MIDCFCKVINGKDPGKVTRLCRQIHTDISIYVYISVFVEVWRPVYVLHMCVCLYESVHVCTSS